MRPKQLAIVIVAAVLTVAGVGVVLVNRDTELNRPELRSPDAANRAIEQLLRMDARFKAGISLMAYSETLADVLYAVDAFEASSEAASMPSIAAPISEALAHYKWVASTWPMKLGNSSDFPFTLTSSWGRTSTSYWEDGQLKFFWSEEFPNEEDATRYFGPTAEASRAAVQKVRDWVYGDFNERSVRANGENYIDQLVFCVLTRAGDFARTARQELKAITAGT